MRNMRAKKSSGFRIFMWLYAILILVGIGLGLYIFWNFIEAFELSRPQHAIEGYVAQLTQEHICDMSQDVISQSDLNLQDEESCRAYLSSQLENITFRKNPSASNDEQMIYTLRSGPKVIGEVTMSPQKTDKFGFTYWEVSAEEFDLSYLVSKKPVKLTVPETFKVRINGNLLDTSYQTETGIRYDVMEEFYDDYDLPTMVTYSAGPFLGEVEVSVTDEKGNPVVIDETTDYNQFVINNCDEATKSELKAFMDTYIKYLVAFTGSKKWNSRENYYNLQMYLVKGGELDKRMYSALPTLVYAQNKSDVITGITMNHCISIGNERYLCDMTYMVDITGLEGVVQTTNNVKVIAVMTENGLRAEAMTGY